MSPNISGIYTIDQARSIYLCKESIKLASRILKENGNFLCKIFMGEDFDIFLNNLKTKFKIFKLYSPPASRKSSSEIYVIGKKFIK